LTGIPVPEQDKPSVDLISIIARFINTSSYANTHAFVDGNVKTAEVLRDLVEIDGELEAWDEDQEGQWTFTVEKGIFQDEIAFGNQYHRYSDMYAARVWNHYRWARILINETVIRFSEDYPITTSQLISQEGIQRCLRTIRRMSRDTLVSTTVHWRDPRLDRAQRELLDKSTGDGIGVGAAGIPAMMYQLRYATCAPGIPEEYRSWALGILDTVWRVTGTKLAVAIADAVRNHSDKIRQDS
jgi:hypothetical protein